MNPEIKRKFLERLNTSTKGELDERMLNAKPSGFGDILYESGMYHDLTQSHNDRTLKLLTETKSNRETCKGCTFLKGTKKDPKCDDEGFVISSQHGFKGGCDNPKLISGVFVWENES